MTGRHAGILFLERVVPGDPFQRLLFAGASSLRNKLDGFEYEKCPSGGKLLSFGSTLVRVVFLGKKSPLF